MKLTPAMKQYMDVKAAYPDAVLLFRMGDFYETFFDDAKTVSNVLNITLTSRGTGATKTPLAGIPYHALDRYLGKLIAAGYTVALCEQLEDPKKAKGVVKRGVTRVLTPGTITEENLLQNDKNNYLCSLFGDEVIHFAFLELSTGRCYLGSGAAHEVRVVLEKLQPTEILYHSGIDYIVEQHTEKYSAKTQSLAIHEYAQPKDISLDAFAKIAQNNEGLMCAVHGMVRYLLNCKQSISHVKDIRMYEQKDYVGLDKSTIEHLEIINGTKKDLFSTLNTTKTAMGARLLKHWIQHPLADIVQIKERQATVREFFDQQLQNKTREYLQQISDLERISTKLAQKTILPKELLQLANHILLCKTLYAELANHNELLSKAVKQPVVLNELGHIAETIKKKLKDDPATLVREGNIIREGIDDQLDELRTLATDAKKIIAQMQQKEQQQTNISSLKIKYNKVFGYFIEVPARYGDSVPEHYSRKQTLANAERFVTTELNELEHKIFSAQEKSHQLEYEHYQALLEQVADSYTQVQELARHIATLDVLVTFSYQSNRHRFILPEFTSERKIILTQARHPVVERYVEQYITNNTAMTEDNYLHILTGPNMAGKSTYMRQIALNVLLAHCGCGVAAKEATIPVVDRIFTRIGAKDDLASGRSTFMVEMEETATILQNATNRSLVLLDEIGRGTSTFDGVSLAYAIAEDIRTRIKAFTIFATHYHILIDIGKLEGAQNYHITISENEGSFVFLHKVVKGGTDKSYGIHVAKMAGVPNHVVEHAQRLQIKFSQNDSMKKKIVVDRDLHISQQTTLGDMNDN